MAAIPTQVRLKHIRILALEHGLDDFGAFHPELDDFSGAKTLVLLGPLPSFWGIFKNSPEYLDGQKDPIDRWSERVISQIADQLDGQTFFPFGGAPYAPFLKWAMDSGRAWSSPVGMLVHERVGLMVSYRGAIGFDSEIPVTTNAQNPCDTCAEKPCLDACPVAALTSDGYDVTRCRDYLGTQSGQSCMTSGCTVRIICPHSVAHSREVDHTRLHMNAFKGKT